MHQTAIILYAREPKPGFAKTRLAAAMGNPTAAEVYSCMLEHAIEELKKLPPGISVTLSGATESDAVYLKSLALAFWTLEIQSGNDIGERMKMSFHAALTSGHTRALLIGSDIPDMNEELLLRALTMLDTHDVVMGPAFDGGYYLLGLKKLVPELFEDIPWSTELVFSASRKILVREELSHAILPRRADVDDVEDLLRWVSETGASTLRKKLRSVLSRHAYNDIS
jgi:rSAM/selenodomain-associated transferase 1